MSGGSSGGVVRVLLGRDAVDDGVVRFFAEHAIVDLILDSDQVVTAGTGTSATPKRKYCNVVDVP